MTPNQLRSVGSILKTLANLPPDDREAVLDKVGRIVTPRNAEGVDAAATDGEGEGVAMFVPPPPANDVGVMRFGGALRTDPVTVNVTVHGGTFVGGDSIESLIVRAIRRAWLGDDQ